MEKLSINEVLEFTKGELVYGKSDSCILNISIDSREVNSETLFIPIIGARFDGHDFMEDAYNLGCKNFLCDKNHEFVKDDINLISVSDTKEAFGLIAKGYKNKFSIPFIGITGSVGKTSTKDIISSVLNVKYDVLKTEGNFNNDIGLPKMLLKLSSSNDIGVLEMGMDKKGEINYLTNLVNPDIGVITNIGMSHIMNFSGQEGIFNAKMEIVNGLKENGLLIVNGDDKFLGTLKEKEHNYRLLTYGFNPNNDIYCKSYEIGSDYSKFICAFKEKEYEFTVNSIAKHNIGNAMASILIGFELGLSEEELRKGLLNLEFSKNRLDIFDTSKYKIINDTYNSSYDSVMSALEVLNSFKGRKVAILGDIFELGDYCEEVHRKIGKEISCDLLITIGESAKYIYDECLERNLDCYYFSLKEDFYKEMNLILCDGDVVLVKASNGMKFSEIVECLKDKG